MAMNFTPDQQRVIDTRNSNILVSAAAGSGKTAVLVERIIQMITDERHPVDIDRLLIVTFTSAAAAQMRERISKAVAKKLEENPENEHLQKQTSLIHNAQITTIDSFCLFVIRNNFNEIGLDPAFRVADESEIKMLEADVMGRLLEEAHTEPTERFLHFIECYSTGANEKKIEEAILRLYHFSMSYPFPEDWLADRLADYRLKDISELSGKKWFQGALAYVNTILQECLDRLHQAIRIAGSANGPVQYLDNLTADAELITRLKQAADYNELYDLFTYSAFTRLSAKKTEGVDPVLKDMVKAIRDEVKKNVADLKKLLFQISAGDTLSDMTVCQEVVEELVSLTLSFKEKLDAAKRDKNIIDFSDMEHFALQILLKKDENGKIVPGNTALELQDYFEEIMIDEYQDSNEVQELLLKSISGEEKGRFNRFMVGDVKQSIYKFRLARPEIFMEKYDTYVTNSADSKQVRIDLSVNFRSRREVTDAANFLCGQLMSHKVGNVEYDDKAALYAGASYPEPEEQYGENIYQTELLLATPDSLIQEENLAASGNYSEKEIEAVMTAERIRQLVGSFPVTDSVTGEIRTAKYSDIVLLFRATAGWDEEFRRILTERGIPVHVTSKTGYFETLEIQGIVNFLRVLDNPLQDIPLFGVLKLAYFDFTEEEITLIRCFARDYQERQAQLENRAVRKLFLYEQIKLYHETLYEKESEDEALNDKNLDNEEPEDEALNDKNLDNEEPEDKALNDKNVDNEEPEDKALNDKTVYNEKPGPEKLNDKILYAKKPCDKKTDCDGEDFTEWGEGRKQKRVSRDKLERLLNTITEYRKRVAYTPIKELLQQLIATMGYEAYVGSMPGGDQRRANLELLLEKAGAFQNTSFYGLFHFIRYLETIQEQEVDFGEANILDENADVVRIMTIHKSKGLEFPICFVCGLSKQFNQMDTRQSILMDAELGVGVDYINPDLRLRRKTMRKNVVAQRMKEDTRGEDLRVLYVALTRAKEKLILTGYVSDFDKKLGDAVFLTMESAQKLPYSVIMHANSYMDMILAALIRHRCMKEALEERGFEYTKQELPYMNIPIDVKFYKEADGLSEKLGNQLQQQGRAAFLEEELERSAELADTDMAKKLRERLHYEYPHAALEGLTVKTTVSELKKASYKAFNEDDFDGAAELVVMPKESYIPSFAQQEPENMTDVSDMKGVQKTGTVIGTQYGTVVHKIMELLSFSDRLRAADMEDEKTRKRVYAVIRNEQEQWTAEGRITSEELSCVSMSRIMGFFGSGLSQRMIAAEERNELFKEQPFVLGISANQLKESYPASETVLIQGVIDVFFYEGDEIVLADYKTDKVRSAQELIDRYRTQLDYYQLALEQITGKKVKQRCLYSFHLQEEIYV